MKYLFFSFLLLSCINWIHSQNNIISFKQKIDTLIVYLSANYTESKNRYINGQYNDVILNRLTYYEWIENRSFKSTKTLVNANNKYVKQRIHFVFQQFETTETCNKAFDELLNCLGSDCQSLKWDEDDIVIKTTPFIYLKTEYNIVFCKINCKHPLDNWTEIENKILKVFTEPGAKLITAKCNSVVTFKTIK